MFYVFYYRMFSLLSKTYKTSNTKCDAFLFLQAVAFSTIRVFTIIACNRLYVFN